MGHSLSRSGVRENVHIHPPRLAAPRGDSLADEEELERMDWRHKAACLDEDPELFFPIGNTGPGLLEIEVAKQVCRRCDVRDACLQWALEAGQDHGVWGGLSEDDRRALTRRPARARIRTVWSFPIQATGTPVGHSPAFSDLSACALRRRLTLADGVS